MQENLSPTPQPISNQTVTSSAQPSIENSVQPQPKRSNMLLLVLIGLIVLASVGVGGYYLGNSQSFVSEKNVANVPVIEESSEMKPEIVEPTASLEDVIQVQKQTYTNPALGVSFQYPEGWTAKELNGWVMNVFIDNKNFEIAENTEFKTPIQVYVNETNDGEGNVTYTEKTVAEYAEFLKTNFYGNTVEEAKTTVNGKPAILLSGLSGPGMFEGFSYRHTIIQLDEKVLIVSLENHPEYLETYNEIVQSIKVE